MRSALGEVALQPQASFAERLRQVAFTREPVKRYEHLTGLGRSRGRTSRCVAHVRSACLKGCFMAEQSQGARALFFDESLVEEVAAVNGFAVESVEPLCEIDGDAIVMMTIHAAKGLEFPIVYILDANEGITPHSRAMLDEDMEEERRLFYVAMTRAKTRLHVYAVRERYHKKAEVSRFVWEYLGRDGDSRYRNSQ